LLDTNADWWVLVTANVVEINSFTEERKFLVTHPKTLRKLLDFRDRTPSALIADPSII
jgi:hypothetical protein